MTDSGTPGNADQPHRCGGAGADELSERVLAEPWLVEALHAVAGSGLPDAWIGAGALRDLVWGQLGGGFDPTTVRDVDVAFLDPQDLRRERDGEAQLRLVGILDRPWEATNQAAVHTWYSASFGGLQPASLHSIHDAVATWPETATCVAVRLSPDGSLDICAPLGLSDLLRGVWRRNPARVSLAESLARLARHDPASRWPHVTVIPPA